MRVRAEVETGTLATDLYQMLEVRGSKLLFGCLHLQRARVLETLK